MIERVLFLLVGFMSFGLPAYAALRTFKLKNAGRGSRIFFLALSAYLTLMGFIELVDSLTTGFPGWIEHIYWPAAHALLVLSICSVVWVLPIILIAARQLFQAWRWGYFGSEETIVYLSSSVVGLLIIAFDSYFGFMELIHGT